MDVAIIGMQGRFPGAQTIEAFWHNLVSGTESISRLTCREMLDAGVEPALLKSDHYVGAAGVVDHIEAFDAAFFGYTPREAALIDPQQRLFLECAWGALEDAGYVPSRFPGRIGVFGSVGVPTYLLHHVYPSGSVDLGALFLAFVSNDKDFVTTRVSYKFDLHGPSLNIQTACSSSLVAVHLACQSLLLQECDMVLAGGCSIRVPQRAGYLYQQEGIESPDGHCRAFDAAAAGTVFSSGVGIVVLKRLEDALSDHDRIYAVIRGSAVNNDGAMKVGYTAPSFEGQSQVVAEALAVAEVSPESLAFVEAHGTATSLGDSVEVGALKRVFSRQTARRGFCALGSVKTNIGHLDTAAGVVGLIKAALALYHKVLPPSLYFEHPNPLLELDHSPFFVNTAPWSLPPGETPLRAGVSSFGIGGTNAHVILEEAPERSSVAPPRVAQLLLLSARSPEARDEAMAKLQGTLSSSPDLELADVAYTLQMGREAFPHRVFVVADHLGRAAEALATPTLVETGEAGEADRRLCFVFPGQGAQYVGMGRGLYQVEPAFTEPLEAARAILQPVLGLDLLALLYAEPEDATRANERLAQTRITQPALFAIEYALAGLLRSWGLEPDVMLGHSLGEYVAACLAGIFTFEDGLRLVARRGELMQALPPGDMVAVDAPPEAIHRQLVPGVSLAAVNGASDCVLSGAPAAVRSCVEALATAGLTCRARATSHAFHSEMMEPMLAAFHRELLQIRLCPPQRPVVSNLSGDILSAAQATDPNYWCQHLRQTVQYAAGLDTVLADPDVVCVEVGPGQTLTALARRHPRRQPGHTLLATMRHPQDAQEDSAFLLRTAGRLWLAGRALNWDGLHPGPSRRRVSLPTYPFARTRHWIDVDPETRAASVARPPRESPGELAVEFYLPSWTRRIAQPRSAPQIAPGLWLIFASSSPLMTPLIEDITARGGTPVVVYRGETFERRRTDCFTIVPDDLAHHVALLKAVQASGERLAGAIYAWGLGADRAAPDALTGIDRPGFYGFLSLLRALETQVESAPLPMALLLDQVFDVLGTEPLDPAQALYLGPFRSLTQEFPHVRGLCLDPGDLPPTAATRIMTDLLDATSPPVLAYRGVHAWVPAWEEMPAATSEGSTTGGPYLITGGLGHIGLEAAQVLADLSRGNPVHLYLTSRSPLPRREAWEQTVQNAPPSDRTATRIRQLQALERAGAIVHTSQVDVADFSEMAALIAGIVAQHGRLGGVIHAAGTVHPEAFVPIAELEPAQCDVHFQSKVVGLQVLARVLADIDVEFCCVLSSVSTLLGGVGYSAYAAANAYMDAFCRRQARAHSGKWLSMAWDAWDFEDQWLESSLGVEVPESPALPPEAGRAALRHLLSHRHAVTGGEVAITWGPLAPRLQAWQAAAQASSAIEPRAPLTTIRDETQVPAFAQLWSDVLGVESVDPADNFFSLGGSSLLALQLLSRLRRDLQVDISLRDFLTHSTLGDLEQFISERHAMRAAQVADIPRVPRDQPLPLSLAQQRLWLADQIDGARGTYHITEALHLRGPLHAQALERSFREIVIRHESLRTRFESREGQPVQVIDPPPDRVVEMRSWTPPMDTDLVTALRPIAETAFSTPFDLETESLLRIHLLQLAAEEHVLLLTLHHIIADDWSIGILLTELSELYNGFVKGEPPALAALPIQYADYAAWQQQPAYESALQASLAYWTQRLAGAPTDVPMPVDRPRQGARTFQGGHHVLTISAARIAKIRALAERASVSQFVVLLTAFKCLLYGLSGIDDIVVGTPIAGRKHPQLAPLVGYFINTVVLRTDLSGDPTFQEALARVSETTLDADAHEDLPFERLVTALRVDRDPTRTPLFHVWFTVLTHTAERSLSPEITMQPLHLGPRPARFDLALILEPSSHGMIGYLEYSADRFEPATVSRIENGFQCVLDTVVTEPSPRLSALTERLRQLDQEAQSQQSQILEQQRRASFLSTRRKAQVEADSQVVRRPS